MGRVAAASFVYLLHDPTDCSHAIYVGWARDLRQRETDRGNEVKRGLRRLVHQWMRKLAKRSVAPRMELLEVVPPAGDWAEAEMFWIAYYRSIGAEVLNMTDGGEGRPGYKMPAEVRAKIGRANLGNKAFEGKTHSDAVRAGMRARMLGTTVSERTKEKLRLANLGKVISPEARAKISAANMGRRPTAATRLRLSAAASNRRYSDDERQRMSRTMTGYRFGTVRPHSKTGFKGVSRCGDRFVARIKIDGKVLSLKTHPTPEDAARAYDEAARKAWGADAALNFPGPGEKSARKPK